MRGTSGFEQVLLGSDRVSVCVREEAKIFSSCHQIQNILGIVMRFFKDFVESHPFNVERRVQSSRQSSCQHRR